MKGKKILGLLCLSAGLLLASCSPSEPGPTSSEVPPASSSSELPPESSSEVPPDTSSAEQVTHRGGLNKTLAEGAITRTYDERFDAIVEDFSGASLLGTTDGTSHAGYLREVVDSELESFQNSPDAAIFKMASSTFEGDKTIIGTSVINIKMRVASGKLALKDLVLGIRPSDNNSGHVYEIPLSTAVDGDQEKLPELSSEYKTLSISVGETVGDENTTFPGTTLKVLSEAIGFHLYVKSGSNVSAVVEIAEVSYSKGESTVAIDDFARSTIAGNDKVYWGPTDCADAVLVRKGVELGKDKKYTTPALSDAQKKYGHVVIDALGDLSKSTVEVTYDDTSSTVKSLPFASLKAKSDKAVVNVVDGVYSPIAIDLSTFAGPEGAKVKTISIKNTGDVELQIANVFLTDFEEPKLDKKYPHLNTATAVTFDNFERNFASLGSNWDESAADERNVGAGINGFISYSNGANISTSGGALNLPGVTEGYDEVTIGSTHTLANAQYLVFSIKAEEGADLSSFRFEMGKNAALWFNAAMAMEGVKTYGDAAISSPYVTEAGYTWYVVDLHYHNLPAGDLINIYYSGTKAISISSIFYANSFSATKIRDGAVSAAADADLAAYVYGGNAGPAMGGKYLGVKVKGDGTATLKSFRIGHNGGDAVWLKDGKLAAYDSTGRKVTADEVIPTTGETYYFDFSDDNFAATGDGWTHLHLGALDGATGKVTIESIFVASAGTSFASFAEKDVTVDNGGYGYLGGWDVTAHTDRIKFTISGNELSDLSLFRIEHVPAGKTKTEYWANANAGMLKDGDGNAITLTNKIKDATTVYLDLSVLGISVEKGDIIHLHNTADAAGWNLKYEAATAYSDEVPYGTGLSSYVETWA